MLTCTIVLELTQAGTNRMYRKLWSCIHRRHCRSQSPQWTGPQRNQLKHENVGSDLLLNSSKSICIQISHWHNCLKCESMPVTNLAIYLTHQIQSPSWCSRTVSYRRREGWLPPRGCRTPSPAPAAPAWWRRGMPKGALHSRWPQLPKSQQTPVQNHSKPGAGWVRVSDSKLTKGNR